MSADFDTHRALCRRDRRYLATRRPMLNSLHGTAPPLTRHTSPHASQRPPLAQAAPPPARQSSAA
eukprot:6847791-Prymnesium_polylepis.1